ncbi:MAG: OsmC family protein, partial [Caulobacteraceae bacterium]
QWRRGDAPLTMLRMVPSPRFAGGEERGDPMLSKAKVAWTRGDGDFLSGRYSRAHTLTFDGGVVVAGSSSPAVVPLPLSVEAAVDPEEMFVASLSACHMLWFLDFARRIGADVASYTDEASGELTKAADGRSWVSKVTLRPDVRYADPVVPRRLTETLHHQAHQACFIANSVKTDIAIEPVEHNQEERHHG